MEFPVQLTFKLFALAPQIQITDSSGAVIFFVRQKLLKFKEDVEVYSSPEMTTKLFNIKADKVIDWSARYTFFAPDGTAVGAIKRSGMKSLWAAHYTIFDRTDQPLFELEQLNPWGAMFDSFLSQIPVIGLFTGYFLNPVYAVRRPQSQENAMLLIKQRRFLESGFQITKDSPEVTEGEAAMVFLGAILVTLLERMRG